MARPPGQLFFVWYAFAIIAQLAAMLLFLRFAFPDFLRQQLQAGPAAFSLVFAGMVLFVCFFEWFFHRYVLHMVIWKPLARFCKAHTHHHELTPIKLLKKAPGQEHRVVLNRYPIETEEQLEDAAFPEYALTAFWILFLPLLLPLQFLQPHLPIVLGGLTGIAWSVISYEAFHAVEHFRYEWWKGAVEHPVVGPVMTRVYGFHHFHHANIRSNEAISGFFGLPVADWCFGTYFQPKNLLLDKRVATIDEFQVPDPATWVKKLDEWAKRRHSQLTRPPRRLP